MLRTHIVATGAYVPPRRVTNEDLTRWMDTTHDWIVQRTGIEARHWLEGEIGGSDLAKEAAKIALDRAGWTVKDLDMIVYATLSPDVQFPGSGCLLASKMNVVGIPVLDIRQQCSGFLYALNIADQFIRTGHHKRIMIVGAEAHSVALDITTRGRDVSVIFGDGSGVVLVEGRDTGDDTGLLMSRVHSDGKHWDKLMVEGPRAIGRPFVQADELLDFRHTPHMEGQYVFKHAVRRLQEAIEEALASGPYTIDQFDLLIPHQANMRINQMVAGRMGLPEEKLFHNMQEYGNTTAASIPIAMDECIQKGLIGPGKLVMLAAFGAGFTWGSAVVRF